MSDEGDRVGLDTDELPRAKDAVQYMVDKRLMRRIDRMAHTSCNLVQEPSLPIRAGVLPHHLEPSDWRAGYLDWHDYEPPPELYGALKQAAPQALLRDLFRPEPPQMYYQEREFLWTHDWSGTEAYRNVREARRRDPIPYVDPLIREVTQISQRWQRVVSERWKPILDDSEPRKRVTTFREPALNW